jgi:hypothetical protein
MRRLLTVLSLGTLGLMATSAIASTAQSGPTPENVADAALAAYTHDFYGGRYERALTDIQNVKVDSDNTPAVALLAALRASALLCLKRNSEAEPLIAQVRKIDWQDPEPDKALFLGGVFSDRIDVAADALNNMIARYPDAARNLNSGPVDYYFSKAPPGQGTDDQWIALAKLGYGGDTETGHYFTFKGVKLLAQRGDIAGARSLINYVSEPAQIEDLLVMKRFAALWPDAAEVAGPHLSKIGKALVQSAQRRVDQAHDNEYALQNLARALQSAGRLDDAIALKAKLPQTPAEMAKADEQTGWLVDNVAEAMHAAGDWKDADRLFELLNDAPIPNEDWRVNMKINRLGLLIEDGRFDRALPLIEPTAQTDGSDYAKQVVRVFRYRTYIGLGRAGDAAELLPEILAHAKDAYAATIDGLLCGAQFDTAEKVALQALAADKDGTFAEDFVLGLQVAPLDFDTSSDFTKRWAEFRKRPAIAAAFDRLGRDMPPEFLPQIVGTK